VVNEKKTLYRLIVDSDDGNRIISTESGILCYFDRRSHAAGLSLQLSPKCFRVDLKYYETGCKPVLAKKIH
jgi:hypothetical protein